MSVELAHPIKLDRRYHYPWHMHAKSMHVSTTCIDACMCACVYASLALAHACVHVCMRHMHWRMLCFASSINITLTVPILFHIISYPLPFFFNFFNHFHFPSISSITFNFFFFNHVWIHSQEKWKFNFFQQSHLQ